MVKGTVEIILYLTEEILILEGTTVQATASPDRIDQGIIVALMKSMLVDRNLRSGQHQSALIIIGLMTNHGSNPMGDISHHRIVVHRPLAIFTIQTTHPLAVLLKKFKLDCIQAAPCHFTSMATSLSIIIPIFLPVFLLHIMSRHQIPLLSPTSHHTQCISRHTSSQPLQEESLLYSIKRS